MEGGDMENGDITFQLSTRHLSILNLSTFYRLVI